jgi:hydroxyacylglutathione hydrolase
MIKHPQIIPIVTSIANLYLILGEGAVLVDTGNPGNAALVIDNLEQRGLKPRDLKLILLTHAHGDHLGSAAALRERTGAPIALHRADLDMARAGHQALHPTGLDGRLLARFFSDHFEPLEPDIILEDETTLTEYGLDAQVIETPGHTAGSVSLILSDGQAIIGDVMRGDFMLTNRPARHFFADDLGMVHSSVQRLAELPLTTLNPGHGRRFTRVSLERRLHSLIPLGA